MAQRQKTVFEPKTVTISGTTYAAAKLEDFPLKPIARKEIGGIGGVQYLYHLEDSTAYWDLLDHLARAACDVADEEGDTNYRVLAIYSDLAKI
jgi:hypothetical protein